MTTAVNALVDWRSRRNRYSGRRGDVAIAALTTGARARAHRHSENVGEPSRGHPSSIAVGYPTRRTAPSRTPSHVIAAGATIKLDRHSQDPARVTNVTIDDVPSAPVHAP
jgi:hypothetical protein